MFKGETVTSQQRKSQNNLASDSPSPPKTQNPTTPLQKHNKSAQHGIVSNK